MANEIKYFHDDAADTLYLNINNSAYSLWNATTSQFVTFNIANWDDYDISMSEISAASSGNGIYQGSWPAALTTSGFYWINVYKQLGASPAQTDVVLARFVVYSVSGHIYSQFVGLGTYINEAIDALETHGDSAWATADVATALNTYDPPTRTEATADKAEITAAIDALETHGDENWGNDSWHIEGNIWSSK